MLERWLSRLETIHRAGTPEEREAVYRFRYQVYVKELGREIGGVDHGKQWVRDEHDEKEYAMHLTVGSGEKVAGALRICIWGPGRVPAPVASKYSLDLLPGIDALHTAELGRLMIRPTLRGRLVLPSLMREAYVRLAGEAGTDLVFLSCRPGLVRYYRKLGARPYPGRLLEEPEGMEVPLVSVLSDLAFFRHVGSPLVPLVRKHFGPKKRPPLDLTPFEDLFEKGLSTVETDTGKVWELLQHDFIDGQKGSGSILDSLSERAVKQLSGKGFVVEVPAGTLVTREGHSEKEMYFILDGSFEAFSGDRRFEVMTRGDLFGEVAFFREGGRRSASVRSLTNGRLLCLRRRFLDELAKKDPQTAHTILFNLGRILSERLVSVDRLLKEE
jgi:CRP-like cAMP-binding protein